MQGWSPAETDWNDFSCRVIGGRTRRGQKLSQVGATRCNLPGCTRRKSKLKAYSSLQYTRHVLHKISAQKFGMRASEFRLSGIALQVLLEWKYFRHRSATPTDASAGYNEHVRTMTL